MRHSSGALLPAEATLCSIKYKSMLSMCTVHESSLELLPHTIEPLGCGLCGFPLQVSVYGSNQT